MKQERLRSEPFGFEEVGPLFQLLDESAEGVAAAALRAIVRLPLQPEVWRKISDYIAEDLREDASWEKRRIARSELIAAAAFVPTRPIRQHLHELIGGQSSADRSAAAHALAAARDPSAIPRLLEELAYFQTDPELTWQAALALANLDVSSAKRAVNKIVRSHQVPDVRLLLAIALSRRGENKPLERVLARIDNEPDFSSRFYFDFQKIDPLPEPAKKILERFASDEKHPTAKSIAQHLLLLTPEPPRPQSLPELEPADSVTRAQAEQLAQDWMLRSPFDESGTVSENVQLLKHVGPETATELTSALCAHLANDPHAESGLFSVQAGNQVVDVVHSFEAPFAPDIPALLKSYKRVGGGRNLQIAWIASRAGLDHLVEGLSQSLKAGERNDQIAAAQLIESGATYVGHEFPPVFGGGSAPADVRPPSELIEEINFEDLLARKRASLPEAKTGKDTQLLTLEEAAAREPVPSMGPMTYPPRESKIRRIPRLIGTTLKHLVGAETEAAEEMYPGPAFYRLSPMMLREDADEVVNTGLVSEANPNQALDLFEPLRCNEQYYFWIGVGKPDPKSIEKKPTSLPELPEGARLTVTLFGFENEIEIVDPDLTGELLRTGGGVIVSRPADEPAGVEVELAARRLFFSIATPADSGLLRFRCNIYCEQVLIQSRLISVRVETAFEQLVRSVMGKVKKSTSTQTEPALVSVLDYNLSESLDAVRLAKLKPHCLSMMLNDNGDGTHGIRIFGSDGNNFVKDDIALDGNTLTDHIERPRRALNRVAWGSPDNWDGTKLYSYDDGAFDYNRLTNDLARLAVAGYRTYAGLINKLAGQDPAPLEQATRQSGLVQVALKESATFAFPAGVLYDIHWDTNAFPIDETPSYSLCPTFAAALKSNEPLEKCVCFHGSCPVRAKSEELRKSKTLIKELGPRICPSGFWGYRHAIGLPLSMKGAEVATEIVFAGAPAVAIGIATNLKGWAVHESNLHKLRAGVGWTVADTRDEVLKLLKTTNAHVIYFYCHGGLSEEAVPFLTVGTDEMNISPDQFLADAIHWASPQPLVFINGCRTTAVTPKLALQFVNPFVQQAAAAGVIGTEITVFEPLASTFAEECLRRFFNGDQIGDAVRGARLTLLKQGNPLGLAYIPFVLPSLCLCEASK